MRVRVCVCVCVFDHEHVQRIRALQPSIPYPHMLFYTPLPYYYGKLVNEEQSSFG